jgi:hypothetical protein
VIVDLERDLREMMLRVTDGLEAPVPTPGLVDRARRRRAGTAFVAGIAVLAVVMGGFAATRSLSSDRSGEDISPAATNSATPESTPPPLLIPSSGPMDPGTYQFMTFDLEFDASYRITVDVPDGYMGFQQFAIQRRGEKQGISAWVVGNVYGDPCNWRGTLLEPPAGSSVDSLVAALAKQKGRQPTAPTNTTVDGFTAKYLEMTVPAGIELADCDGGQFRTWVDTSFAGNPRFLEPGQRDLLWIVDVDGTPVVIDAALGTETGAQERAESLRIIESIRIDPLREGS